MIFFIFVNLNILFLLKLIFHRFHDGQSHSSSPSNVWALNVIISRLCISLCHNYIYSQIQQDTTYVHKQFLQIVSCHSQSDSLDVHFYSYNNTIFVQ